MKNSKGEVTSSLPNGFKDKVSYPQDNSGSHKVSGSETGGKMGGSTTNLSHSLTGTSAVQK